MDFEIETVLEDLHSWLPKFPREENRAGLTLREHKLDKICRKCKKKIQYFLQFLVAPFVWVVSKEYGSITPTLKRFNSGSRSFTLTHSTIELSFGK